MSSPHTGDPATFYREISLLDATDRQSATQLRQIFASLHDNTAFLHQFIAANLSRSMTALREKTPETTLPSDDSIAVVSLVNDLGYPGPILAVKSGTPQQIGDGDGDCLDDTGGAIPNLTQCYDGATSDDGRLVVVGAGSPFNAYRTAAGAWTAGGANLGSTTRRVIYLPGVGFLAGRSGSANVFSSPDGATAWSSAASGLPGIADLAVIGAGSGIGRVVALGTGSAPAFSLSINNGVSFTLQGATVPGSLSFDNVGSLAGVPGVTRGNLNGFVYHAGTTNSGAQIRTAKSADGVSWTMGPTITAPFGYVFETSVPVRLLICKQTGVQALICRTTSDRSLIYISLDFTTWFGPGVHLSDASTTAYGIANGKLVFTTGTRLLATDGVKPL